MDSRTEIDEAPRHQEPDVQWSLAGTRPAQLALRLTGAALGAGIVGGVVTAWLSALFGSIDVSPVARVLLVGLPVVLVAMIGWRLVAVARRAGSPPSGWWLGGVAVAGIALIMAAQAWPEAQEFEASALGGALLFALFGAVYGMVPAAVTIVVLVPVLLLLRVSRVRVPLVAAQVLLTVVAIAVTAVFAQWVAASLGSGIVTGVAAALAGMGAVLTAPWCLVNRQA